MGILQARILEWVVMPSSREFLNPEIKLSFPALQAKKISLHLQLVKLDLILNEYICYIFNNHKVTKNNLVIEFACKSFSTTIKSNLTYEIAESINPSLRKIKSISILFFFYILRTHQISPTLVLKCTFASRYLINYLFGPLAVNLSSMRKVLSYVCIIIY